MQQELLRELLRLLLTRVHALYLCAHEAVPQSAVQSLSLQTQTAES